MEQKWQELEMVHAIRAVYENGHLRLLDPLHLSEGEEVELMILTEQEKAKAALGDLIIQKDQVSYEAIDEAALLNEIETAFQGQTPLSSTLIEERDEGR
jgi:predicted DNA-binding antitoxin AbrB/MazE fold protein